ncbi:MAG: tyrosine-type recombinase/integrase [Candidatus Methanoperedens sp.]
MTKIISKTKIIQDFLDELEHNKYSESTLEYYKPILEEANNFKPLQDWTTKEDVIKFVLHLKTKNKESSVETKKGVLKTFFKLTGKKEIVEDTHIRIVKNNLRREDILTIEDIDKLIESTDSPMYKALIAFLFESGARINEALSVKIKNIKETDNGLIIGIADTKTNNNIRESAYIYSAQYIRNHITYSGLTKEDKLFPISDQAVQKMLNKLKVKTGIEKPISPHKFRHAQATDMLTRQYSELIIRKQLGWSPDSHMISRYIHLVDQDVIDARFEKNGLNTVNKKISNIKIAEPLKIADASLQLRKLSEENEEMKKGYEELKSIIFHLFNKNNIQEVIQEVKENAEINLDIEEAKKRQGKQQDKEWIKKNEDIIEKLS